MAKVNLFPDFKQFLESLNKAQVRYLLLGGYAVIYHGYHRMTDDLDVWIALEPENVQKVSNVLISWGGFRPEQVAVEILGTRDKVFIFGREPSRIDILTSPSGVDFESAYAARNIVDLDGVLVPLISLEDLRKNKHASGRHKDHADLENLPLPDGQKSSNRKLRDK